MKASREDRGLVASRHTTEIVALRAAPAARMDTSMTWCWSYFQDRPSSGSQTRTSSRHIWALGPSPRQALE